MAFRRSSRRSFSRPRSRRRGLRVAPRPTRWEFCNFFHNDVPSITDNSFQTNLVSLIQIPGHLGGTGTIQRALEAAARKVLIGGIVFRYGQRHVATAGAPTAAGSLFCQSTLWIDRLDGAGAGAALPDWTINQAPVATAPGSLSDEMDFPDRVLWRDNFQVPTAAVLAGSTGVNGHDLPQVNLRIKRIIDDTQGLFFNHYTFANSVGQNPTVDRWVWGHIYYRFVF